VTRMLRSVSIVLTAAALAGAVCGQEPADVPDTPAPGDLADAVHRNHALSDRRHAGCSSRASAAP
jgi:hypothetical protein